MPSFLEVPVNIRLFPEIHRWPRGLSSLVRASISKEIQLPHSPQMFRPGLDGKEVDRPKCFMDSSLTHSLERAQSLKALRAPRVKPLRCLVEYANVLCKREVW